MMENASVALLLAQHPTTLDAIQATFGLSDDERAAVGRLRTVKGQAAGAYLHAREGADAGVVQLTVTPEEYWLCTSHKPERELRDWIVDRSPQPAEELELSPALRIAMTDYASEVAARATEYARLRDKYVEVDARKLGGTPVIRGTRMPVRTLAELVESGESREVLREDYPHIPEEAYDIAVIWARGNPRRGRPNTSEPKSRTRPSRRAATVA